MRASHARAPEPRLHGFLGDAQHLRRFGLRQPLDRTEDQHLTQTGRKRGDGMRRTDKFVAVGGLDIVGGTVLGDPIGDGVDRQRKGDQAPNRTPTGPIAAFIEGNRREPRPQRSSRIVAPKRCMGGKKSLLQKVERLVSISDVAGDDPENRLPVAAHDIRERLLAMVDELKTLIVMMDRLISLLQSGSVEVKVAKNDKDKK